MISLQRRARAAWSQRRGLALVLVLALVALTLGFSYALLRTQTVDHELQRNQSRRSDARGAAQAGMATALQRLYKGNWSGADTTFTGTLDADGVQGFTVTYTTGDSALTSTSSDWEEYPFRLTIESKGYARDPNTPDSKSEYTVRVVAQLLRRKLSATTASTGYDGFSLCQTSNATVRIEHPVRVNGNLYLQGELQFARAYPQERLGDAFVTFFNDLYGMYANQGWDYRPFAGGLYTPSSSQPAGGDVNMVLDTLLHVPRTDVSTNSSTLVPLGSSFNGYTLYAKGKTYSGAELPTYVDSADEIANAEYIIQPGSYTHDPQQNPLGLFMCKRGRTGITSNTSIQGLILNHISGDPGDLYIAGQNVSLRAKTLPSVLGDAANYRLPAVMVRDDLRIHDGANRTVEGWVVCGDEFQVRPGAASSSITFTGGVFCSKLYLDQRSSVPTSSTTWLTAYTAFALQLFPQGENAYFPGWIKNSQSSWGLDLEHRLIFNPTPSTVTNHMPDLSQPIYVAHPDDGGLAWDLIRWQEIGS